MASEIVQRLRHPKEKFRGALMMIFGVLGWSIVALAALGLAATGKGYVLVLWLLYAIAFWLAGLIVAALYRARALGNHVLISEKQFPALHRMLEEGAAAVGMTRLPRAFLYNSSGTINAYARRLLGGRYVFLASSLVEVDTDAQVRFVIGHELGHHAAGHLNWGRNLLKLPGHVVPFLAPAYSRGRELTCDRIGAVLSGDGTAARSALQMLACGCRRLNADMDLAAFAAQDAMVPPIAGFFVKLLATHPRTTQRVCALNEFEASTSQIGALARPRVAPAE